MRGLPLVPTAIAVLALSVMQVAAAAERSDDGGAEAVEPVHFTAMLSPTGGRSDHEVTFGEGYTRTEWLAVPIGVHDSSDPRFNGTASWRGATDTYRANPSFEVQQGAYRIENEDGAWQQVPTTLLTLRSTDRLPAILIFEGESAYAGLVVVAHASFVPNLGRQLDGVIFEGEVPPMPNLAEQPDTK